MAEPEGGLKEAHIYADVSLSDGPMPYAVSQADILTLGSVLPGLGMQGKLNRKITFHPIQ